MARRGSQPREAANVSPASMPNRAAPPPTRALGALPWLAHLRLEESLRQFAAPLREQVVLPVRFLPGETT